MYPLKSRNSRVAKNSFNKVHKPTNLMLVVVFTVVMLVLTSGTVMNEDAQGKFPSFAACNCDVISIFM